jgi:hypothetical protein
MRDRVESPDVFVRFNLVDIRDLDGERLLASGNMGDGVLAILIRIGRQSEGVRPILKRIADGPAGDRNEALAELFIIAGLRRMEDEARCGRRGRCRF